MHTIMDLCFLCSKDYNCVPVDSKIVSQVESLLPEITIFKLGIPLRICSVCEGALYAFSKFKQFYVESSQRLEARIKGAQCVKDSEAQALNVSDPLPSTDTQQIHNVVEIFIKEEQIEETPLDQPFYSNLTQDILKEECEQNVSVHADTESQPKNESGEQAQDTIEDEWDESFTDSDEEYVEETDGNCSKTTETSVNKNTKNQKKEQHRCNICNELFAYNALLIRHMKKVHWQTKDLSCEVCQKLFTHEYDLNRHMKVHVRGKNYECCVCKKKFLEKGNLKRHLELHVEIKDFYCENCNDTFTLEIYLQYHLQHSGMQVKEKLSCAKCNKTFKYKSLFDRHMKFHSGVRDFQCVVCGKGFMQKYTLVTHMKSHSGVKEFQCEVCSKAFTHKFHMVAHMNTHNPRFARQKKPLAE